MDRLSFIGGVILFRIFFQMDRQIKILLIGVLITAFTTFMLVPFLGLYLAKNSFPPEQIGIILMVLTICQQGFLFFGGVFSDYLGNRRLILLGLTLRILGYGLLISYPHFVILIFSTLLIGLGGAMLGPAIKAGVTSVDEEIRGQALSIRNMAVNMGAALGPLLGGVLYSVSFEMIVGLAIMSHLILAVLIWFYVRNPSAHARVQSLTVSFQAVFRYPFMIWFTLVTSGFWFLYTQFNLTFPLYVKDQFQAEGQVGVLFALNGLLVILLQVPLFQWAEKRLSMVATLQLGMIVMAISFGVLAAVPTMIGLYLFLFLFTVSEIWVIPMIDHLTSSLSPAETMGSFLGFVGMAGAIGGGIGNLMGGSFYGWLKVEDELWMIWVFFGLIAGLTALFYGTFKDNKKKGKERKQMTTS